MIRVKSCCCGCSLRTGTLIILWLFAVPYALLIGLSCYAIIRASMAHHELAIEATARAAVIAGITVLQFAVAGIALFGTLYKKKPSYLWPFLCVRVFEIGTLVFTIMSLCSPLWLWMMQYYSYEYYHYGFFLYVLAEMLICILSTLVSSYLTVVVYSYYKQMVDEIKGINRTGNETPLARVA